eukprot:TRINITY_DN59672_c0_g1_i1.p1 TRINITY_DN59672_c0_g1~~TRINITY_DN59672_c0_g1_i1.p1  ORF type:complete len:320 (+),score=45.92 TRINITY_DN59672_c0_g1_i1:53-961(+)
MKSLPCFREPHYRVLPVVGKGHGVLAVRHISRNELIMRDWPLVHFKLERASRTVMKQFESLSRKEQRAYMSLHDCRAEAAGPASEKTVDGVFLTNGVQTRPFDSVLCEHISRVNHSCTPNCELAWNDSLGCMDLFARTNIPAGTELCISYIDERATRKERSEALKEWNFVCTCHACSNASSASDERRSRLQELGKQLDAEIRMLKRMTGSDVASAGLRDEHLSQDILELLDAEHLLSQRFRHQAAVHARSMAAIAGDSVSEKRWNEEAKATDVETYRPPGSAFEFVKSILKRFHLRAPCFVR